MRQGNLNLTYFKEKIWGNFSEREMFFVTLHTEKHAMKSDAYVLIIKKKNL